ncbi:MAG TPA: sigma-70 family RNA polymerase sigma factor [Candidatus Angelobacter sp.]|nr:sigma-70 family RNA polymerase sigma factor [Candidatus Angelobacter sp.]
MIYSSLSCDELVRACAEGNTEAWEEFVRRFRPVINAAIWRIVLRQGKYDPDLIKDLAQDTFFKLCADNFRVLRRFNPQHENAFYGMVQKVSASVAYDYFRKIYSPKRGAGKAEVELSEAEAFIPDSRATGSDRLEQLMQLQEIDCVLRAHCSARDREIFWLNHGANGFTAAEIAKMHRFQLNEKGVESVLHRLKSLLREKLVEMEKV